MFPVFSITIIYKNSRSEQSPMAIFKWEEKYSVKVQEMDDQHKRLFELINQLHDAMQSGKGNALLTEIVKGLKDYSITHFSAEEKYMEKIKYSGLAEQKEQHRTFIKKVEEYEQQVSLGKLSLSIEVLTFLRDWLVNHIQRVDKKYSEDNQTNAV